MLLRPKGTHIYKLGTMQNKSPLKITLVVTLLGIMASLPIVLLGLIVGPQDLHYYNLFIILVVLMALIYSLARIKVKDLRLKKSILYIVLNLIALLFFIFLSKTWIDVRYGYGNWNFEDPLTLYFDPNEADIKWTKRTLSVLYEDLLKYQKDTGNFPQSINDLQIKEGNREYLDSWDNPITYILSKDSVILKSPGPDSIMNTNDDLTLSKIK